MKKQRQIIGRMKKNGWTEIKLTGHHFAFWRKLIKKNWTCWISSYEGSIAFHREKK